MYIIYNLLLMILTIVLFPYILFRVITVRKYRGGITQKLGRVRKRVLRVIQGTGRPIWVHAVSVGEVMAAHPLIRDLKALSEKKTDPFHGDGHRELHGPSARA
jgi:3-deoxy-D-manno-octulosonic-acid transferase